MMMLFDTGILSTSDATKPSLPTSTSFYTVHRWRGCRWRRTGQVW